jgi:hypothetical protein
VERFCEMVMQGHIRPRKRSVLSGGINAEESGRSAGVTQVRKKCIPFPM